MKALISMLNILVFLDFLEVKSSFRSSNFFTFEVPNSYS